MQRLAFPLVIALVLTSGLMDPIARAEPAKGAQREAPVQVLVVNLNRSAKVSGGAKKLARTLEAMSADLRATVVHYRSILEGKSPTVSPSALVLSPQGDPWPSYPPEELKALGKWVREYDGPILGVCGGHQFLAIAFGGTVAPIRGELTGDSYVGLQRERGPTKITVTGDSPWFPESHQGATITVMENHVEEIKRVPAGFQVIAKGHLSPAQAIAHESRPILGVQFHPENSTKKHPQGRQVLRAFLNRLLHRDASGHRTKPSQR